MIIKDAKIENGWLMIKTSPPEALKQLYGIKVGKDYDIKPHVEKRSRNANAYAWLLLTKLASQLGISKEEAYRHAVENIGGKTDVLSMRTQAVKDFTRAFMNGHIGRNVEILYTDNDKTDVVITYGSSDFNTQQMAQFIDSIVQDCLAIGIETKTKEEIESLINQEKENYHA